MEADFISLLLNGSTPLAAVLAWFMLRAERRLDELVNEVGALRFTLQQQNSAIRRIGQAE